MVSDLKWRAGFGWPSLLLFFVFLVTAVLFNGIFRGFFLSLTMLSGIWLGYKFYTWNGAKWRRVHFRGMMLFASVAGKEEGQSHAEGRAANVINACRAMALLMCGQGKELFVNAMIDKLSEEQGNYFAQLLESQQELLFPKVNSNQIATIIETARKINFGPQLIIGNIIENTYGSMEAARYVLAVLSRQAY